MSANQNNAADKEPFVLYVNTAYNNEATLDGSMENDIDDFGHISWRELLEDVFYEDLKEKSNLEEWLEENYCISVDELGDELDRDTIERYYDDLADYQNMVSGRNVLAFDLLRSLNLFSMDKNGNGAMNGVELIQTTANGPRKYVFIENQQSADWLEDECKRRGLNLFVKFIKKVSR
jgi:hypothetical protein